MDQPDLDPDAHKDALRGLARINRWSRSAEILWPAIASLARANPDRTVRVLDVATGSGDVPIRLAGWATRAGICNLAFAGCDVSETALAIARTAAVQAGNAVEFFRHDAVADALPAGFDAVTCSLFLHHLDQADAETLLGRLRKAAARLVLVNDLVRSRAGFVMVWLASRALTRSPVVHVDGPLSVRAALTIPEARELATRAGMAGAVIESRWPCRFLLTWGPS